MIHFLLYTSNTFKPLAQTDLALILEHARRNNAANGVTGILLYAHTLVMQYLEGPRDAVDRTFEKIRRDPRHYGVQVLLRHDVRERRFDRWSMAFEPVGEDAAVAGAIDLRSTDPVPEDNGRLDAALMMLRNFREGIALM